MHRVNNPTFTSVYTDVGELRLSSNSLYITGRSTEDRGRLVSRSEHRYSSVTFAIVIEDSASAARISIDGNSLLVRLRSHSDISCFLTMRPYSALYLDITGLPHHVWAPFLRGIYRMAGQAYCVYVEPGDYRFSDFPTETTVFDLSESKRGIAPLPGFASLRSTTEETLFVPLLGFEGTRFSHILEEVQPRRDRIRPIIGLPGFRPEYPFHSYVGNRVPLLETKSWQSVRYAPANCPFSLYYLLCSISRGKEYLSVAPIGTRPHALGALLYYLDYPEITEIVYDHPVGTERPTVGVSRVCLYNLSLLHSASTNATRVCG